MRGNNFKEKPLKYAKRTKEDILCPLKLEDIQIQNGDAETLLSPTKQLTDKATQAMGRQSVTPRQSPV